MAAVPVRSAAGRRRVVRSAADLPIRLYLHMFLEMAECLSGATAARACEGMSFAFSLSDRAGLSACYRVGRQGRVSLVAVPGEPATFTFVGTTVDFDAALLGACNPLLLILSRRIGFRGSLLKLRQLLVLLPALRLAYQDCRAALRAEYSNQFDFRF